MIEPLGRGPLAIIPLREDGTRVRTFSSSCDCLSAFLSIDTKFHVLVSCSFHVHCQVEDLEINRTFLAHTVEIDTKHLTTVTVKTKDVLLA